MVHRRYNHPSIETGVEGTYLLISQRKSLKNPDSPRWGIQMVQKLGPHLPRVTIGYWQHYALTDEGLQFTQRKAAAVASFWEDRTTSLSVQNIAERPELIPRKYWPERVSPELTVAKISEYIQDVRGHTLSFEPPAHTVLTGHKGVQCEVNRRGGEDRHSWYVVISVGLPGTRKKVAIASRSVDELTQPWLSHMISEAIGLRHYFGELHPTQLPTPLPKAAPSSIARPDAPSHITCSYVHRVVAWKARRLCRTAPA